MENAFSDSLAEAANTETSALRLTELAENIELQPVIAANPAAPPQLLKRLSSAQEYKTRRAVAQNPNTPAPILTTLAGEFPQEFLDNPIVSMLNLVQPNFVKGLPLNAWLYLLRDEHIPRLWLQQVQRDKHYQRERPDVWSLVQMHVALSGEVKQHERPLIDATARRFQRWLQYSYPMSSFEAQRLFPLVVLLFPHVVPLLKGEWDTLFRSAPATAALLFSACSTIGKKTLSRLASGNNAGVLALVARHGDTSGRVLQSLAKRRDPHVRSAVAQNRNTPLELLSSLATDSDPLVRSRAAANPALSGESLFLLLLDDAPEVRAALASRAHLAPDLFQELAWDSSSSVRAAVARNVTAPAALLTLLSCDSQSIVRAVAAGNPRLPKELLISLRHDQDDGVRSALAGNAQLSPSACSQLIQDPALAVRSALAANPRTPLELLHVLYASGEREILRGLAHHPHIPSALLSELAQQDTLALRVAIAKHKKTPVETLQYLAQSKEPALLLALIYNPHTPEDLLTELLQCDVPDLWLHAARVLLSRNRQKRNLLIDLLIETLQELQQTKQSADYLPNWLRRLLMQYGQTFPASIMEILAPSPQWQERYQVASHPHMSTEILHKLSHDGNRFVRAAARKALSLHQENPL